jgi:hypothetical protein
MMMNNVQEFTKNLSEKTKQFCKVSGVKFEDVNWEYVLNSDWIQYNIVLYAIVPQDWKPVDNTFITGDIIDTSVKTFSDHLVGKGRFTNISEYPPNKPHELFQTIDSSIKFI